METAGRSGGITWWVYERAKMRGLNVWLTPLIGDGFEANYFYLRDRIDGRRNAFIDSTDPVHLLHSSYSNIIHSLLNEGGLVANDYRSSDLPKSSGEGSSSWAGKRVSFWKMPEEAAYIKGGYGRPYGLGVPIAIGISKSKSLTLSLEPGVLQNEVTVERRVGLDSITHIFVPHFVIDETRDLFKAHGYLQIKILPLGFEDGLPIYPCSSLLTNDMT